MVRRTKGHGTEQRPPQVSQRPHRVLAPGICGHGSERALDSATCRTNQRRDLPKTQPPQRERRPRTFCDYTYYGINPETVPLAPQEAMQFRRALQRVLQRIWESNPKDMGVNPSIPTCATLKDRHCRRLLPSLGATTGRTKAGCFPSVLRGSTGLSPSEITERSLRAGGAMALLCAPAPESTPTSFSYWDGGMETP